jgi:uncharacterized protein YjbI with pentapeptide repeats
VGPIALLLWFQIQFLPYHNLPVTWTHRIALLMDLLLIWWLWRNILGGRGGLRGWGSWKSSAKTAPPLVVGVFILLFSWTVATIPAEWPQSQLPSLAVIPTHWQPVRELPCTAINWLRTLVGAQILKPVPAVERVPAKSEGWFSSIRPVSLHQLVFSGSIDINGDPARRRRTSLSSNTLVLPGFDIYEALKIDDPEKVEGKPYLISLRGRHLEGAILDGATLKKTDLTGAFMKDASLVDARLEGASLRGAQLQGASLDLAQLERGPLDDAQLQRASLHGAHLEGASLNLAHLESASLIDAHLEGASLYGAQLQGASLVGAWLQRASLDHAQLEGASLDHAQLEAASLDHARLDGASLNFAHLKGASLIDAQLAGALLYGAELQGASLIGARLAGAWLNAAQLQGASLDHAQLGGARLEEARLEGASLDHAQLAGASLRGALLQGVSFDHAQLGGASLDQAFLWRAQLQNAELKGVYAPALNWRPEYSPPDTSLLLPWTNTEYDALLHAIRSIPETSARDAALNRVAALDCSRTSDTLASCDPSVEPPAAVSNWTHEIESTGVDKPAYLKAYGETLDRLVCSGAPEAIRVLRGLARSARFLNETARIEALVTRSMSPACPVSAALTDDDRAELREIAITRAAE